MVLKKGSVLILVTLLLLSFVLAARIVSPPGNFSLLSPIDDSVNLSLKPTFKWNVSSGSAGYVLEVDDNADFSSVIYKSSKISKKATSFALPINLSAGTTYYWRVNSSNVGGSALALNSPFSFTTLSNPINNTNNSGNAPVLKQLILIGVDGMQYAHYEQMRSAGQLPNFNSLVSGNGFSGSAQITGHVKTETAPGNAELHTGLNENITGVHDNTCGIVIPSGKTTIERLNGFNDNISIGVIYGKGTCYIPEAVLKNAKPLVDWWQNRTSYPQTTYVSSNCADSRNVSTKALEFLNAHKNESFYLVVYYGAPDCAGHTYGENSAGYDNSLINVDQGVGILLGWINQNNASTQVLVSGDHGWNEGTTGHGTANSDTKTIIILSNNASLVGKIYSQGVRKQCDVAPTTLNYFGMNALDYAEITNNNCGSMIA